MEGRENVKMEPGHHQNITVLIFYLNNFILHHPMPHMFEWLHYYCNYVKIYKFVIMKQRKMEVQYSVWFSDLNLTINPFKVGGSDQR